MSNVTPTDNIPWLCWAAMAMQVSGRDCSGCKGGEGLHIPTASTVADAQFAATRNPTKSFFPASPFAPCMGAMLPAPPCPTFYPPHSLLLQKLPPHPIQTHSLLIPCILPTGYPPPAGSALFWCSAARFLPPAHIPGYPPPFTLPPPAGSALFLCSAARWLCRCTPRCAAAAEPPWPSASGTCP